MRPLGTWLLVAALAAVGLVALADALRGDAAREAAPAPEAEQGFSRTGPALENRRQLSASLRALGAEGVLYVTVAGCRRHLLRLPEYRWVERVLGPDAECRRGGRVAWSPQEALSAEEVQPGTIVVASDFWRHRFAGSAPAFRPDGTLTFARGRTLLHWTGRCPADAERVVFRAQRAVDLCIRPLTRLPSPPAAVVWLDQRTFAAALGTGVGGHALVLYQDLVETARARSSGLRVAGLGRSPRGRYVTATFAGGDVVAFDRSFEPVEVSAGGRRVHALVWSPDERLGAVATARWVYVFRTARPAAGALPLRLQARALEWR